MQRKRFEAEALERQIAQMAEADRRKDEFLAILAHELRNPLAAAADRGRADGEEPDAPVPERVRNIIAIRNVEQVWKVRGFARST